MKYTSDDAFLKMHYREPLSQTILQHNVFPWEHIGLYIYIFFFWRGGTCVHVYMVHVFAVLLLC